MSRHCTVKVELIGNRLFPTLFIDVSFSKSTYSSNFWPNMNGSICFYFQEIGFRYSLANFTLETLKSDFVFFSEIYHQIRAFLIKFICATLLYQYSSLTMLQQETLVYVHSKN